MDFYEKELLALQKSGRFRERKVYTENLVDLSSNDYLGLAEVETLSQKACQRLDSFKTHGPKASMLVNGYHPLHQMFEEALCKVNGFEEGIIVGSGFSANIALIESLVRKGDTLFIDELYHASGQLASKLVDGKVITFKHNDPEDLAALLEEHTSKRHIIAVEGIYSMDGDLLHKDIITLANRPQTLLILDEAHSSGVIGPNLLGILDHYGFPVKDNYIKMGTLGKAYGSFGAYILASSHIISYLVNRAKPIIYATAPSLFDTALGLEALHYIQKHKETLIEQIDAHKNSVAKVLGAKPAGLIVPIVIGDNKKVLEIQKKLQAEGFSVGAIRQPTVEKAIIRLIARLGVSCDDLEKALNIVLNYKKV